MPAFPVDQVAAKPPRDVPEGAAAPGAESPFVGRGPRSLVRRFAFPDRETLSGPFRGDEIRPCPRQAATDPARRAPHPSLIQPQPSPNLEKPHRTDAARARPKPANRPKRSNPPTKARKIRWAGITAILSRSPSRPVVSTSTIKADVIVPKSFFIMPPPYLSAFGISATGTGHASLNHSHVKFAASRASGF